MNWQDIKNIIKEELKEATTVNAGDTKFNLRTGVNKNPTKLGIKVQFTPMEGMLDGDVKSALEVALQEKLNDKLKEYDIQVSKDTDVPREDVIGFFIPLSQIKNLIVQSVTGQKAEKPSVAAPEPKGDDKPIAMTPSKGDIDDSPPDDKSIDELKKAIKNILLKEAKLNEVSMKVRELNEISKVVKKEDFYEFINKGNNILRTLEESGIGNGKKYLEYLVKNNIM